MKRKTLALAVAGVFAVPATAFAQQSNVQIYGRLYPSFAVMSSSGATPAGTTGLSDLAVQVTGLNLKSRNSVDAANSRIGFRGTEELGGGLRAVWQLEQTVPLDTGIDGTFATRTSFVGLRGGFGTVKLGNMDTVYKSLGDPIGILGISSGNFMSLSNIISSRVPFGGSAGSFHLRAANSVLYESPTMGGFQLFAQWSPGGTSGGPNDEDRTATDNTRPQLWSLGATYAVGGLTLSLAHEIHEDFYAGSTSPIAATLRNDTTIAHSKDRSTRGTVMYRFGNGRVSLDLANIEFTESGQAPSIANPRKCESYKHTTWSVVWEHRWGGPWRTALAYANSSAGSCKFVVMPGSADCGTSGLSGNMVVVGGDYSLSKRTALYAVYAKLNNGQSSIYRNALNAGQGQIAAGTDLTHYAIGIRHDF